MMMIIIPDTGWSHSGTKISLQEEKSMYKSLCTASMVRIFQLLKSDEVGDRTGKGLAGYLLIKRREGGHRYRLVSPHLLMTEHYTDCATPDNEAGHILQSKRRISRTESSQNAQIDLEEGGLRLPQV